MKMRVPRLIICTILLLLIAVENFAQKPQLVIPPKEQEDTSEKAPEKVEVKPTTRDEEIRQRLEDILNATGWFAGPSVRVQDGVVFLSGETKTDEKKKWAGNLARNTKDVTAVVNKIELEEPSIWDFRDAISGLRGQWRDFLRALPSFFFGLVILVVAWIIARIIAALIRLLLKKKFHKSLLKDVIARAVGVAVFLVGIYVVFEMADLTNVALTILGGTGLLGIILGIAFRDITENLLASVLLSIQHPFRNGDLIEIEGIVGYVQRLTMRVTMLMTLEGNHVQIPNSTVYKSNIRNFTSNPNRREEFVVGIGTQDVISKAQEIALKVLDEHSVILKDPEPWVLVDSFGKSTINLRIYFWFNGKKHSWLKVRSSVMRLVKRAFQEGGISMPDEARERIFPDPVPVHLLKPEEVKAEKAAKLPTAEPSEDESKDIATDAESELSSEAEDIKELGDQSRLPEKGKNFLERGSSSKKSS